MALDGWPGGQRPVVGGRGFMSGAEWAIVLAALALWLAGTAAAFTWPASGYPAGWLNAWPTCWAAVSGLCALGLQTLARGEHRSETAPS